MIHPNPHPLAGRTVTIQSGEFKDAQYRLEDWWDRVSGKSWMFAKGNPACIQYALRTSLGIPPIPADDEVVYGKVGMFGHLVHQSELGVCPEEAQPNP